MPSRDDIQPWLPSLAVGLGVVAFAVLHTVLAGWKSAGLMSEWGFDLTFFHNLVWNVAEGNGYRQSGSYHEAPGLFAETHFEPILLLAAPFYRLAPGLETLFAVQSILLGLGAVGVYRLARSTGAGAGAATAGAWAYLLWWPLWRMAMADIRPLMWSVPFLLLLAASLREARHWEAFTWGLLACLCREEIPLMVAFLCAGSLLWRSPPAQDRRRTAIALGAAALTFLVVTTALRSNASFYIRPLTWLQALAAGSDPDITQAQWGHSPTELLPVRLSYLGEWLLPAGLGVLLAPEVLLATLPLFVYLFSQAHEWASWEGPYIHHAAPAAALFAAAAALGWGRLFFRGPGGRRLPSKLALLLFCGVLASEVAVLAHHWERTVEPELRPWLDQEARVVEAHALAGIVPSDASVMADWDTVHLFSGRAFVYSYHQEAPEPVSPGPTGLREPLLPLASVQPDWALIDREDRDWLLRAAAAGMERVEGGDEWLLLQRRDTGGR